MFFRIRNGAGCAGGVFAGAGCASTRCPSAAAVAMAALPVMNSLREVLMVDSSFSGGPLANNHMLYREDYTSYFSTEGGTHWSHAGVARSPQNQSAAACDKSVAKRSQ